MSHLHRFRPPVSRRTVLNRSVDRLLNPPMTRDSRLLAFAFLCFFLCSVLFIAWCRYSDRALELGEWLFG